MKPESATPRDHYSYTVYADQAVADRFEASRFGGPIGQLLARTQEETMLRFLDPIAGLRILDVGSGTGRAAISLARHGAEVTAVDASSEMLAVAERRARDAGARVTFAHGDAHHLEFADRSFDAVVCLRVLMHTPDWRQSLGELCRVADRRVVIDYPSATSAAALEAGFRRVAHLVAPATEAYRVFSSRSIARELRAHGYRLAGAHRQFVLPIALHKRIGSERWTQRIERTFERVGLLGWFGSPVTIVAERCAS